MQLQELSLQNFRQFKDNQALSFSTDSEQNVTVIHGSNGSGKSTILNAFLWLFYDELDLPQSHRLANEQALAQANEGDIVRVEVELEFEHEDRQYVANRWADFQKADDEGVEATKIDDSVNVEFIDTTGEWKERDNPNVILQQILPERLRKLFLFHGETIDEMSGEENEDQIKDAIRNIMGLEVLERGIDHLEKVGKRFRSEMNEYGSDELRELIDEQEDLEDRIESKRDELEVIRGNLEENEDELEQVRQRLSELQASKKLQENRKQLNNERKQLQQDIQRINDDIRSEISKAGFLNFSMPAVQETAEMLNEKRKKGEIPSNIKQQFVEDLLDMHECICGRPLKEGSDEYTEVEEWKEKGGSSDIEEWSIEFSSRLSEMAEDRKEMFEELSRLKGTRSDKQTRIQEIDEELDEISAQLSEKETEDVASLEKQREKLSAQEDEWDREEGRLMTEIDDLEDDLEEVEQEIDNVKEQEEEAQLARRRYKATQHAVEGLQSTFADYQDQVRQSVNDKVNKIFREIISKDYYAEITENYEMKIMKDFSGGETVSVAQSTGERQVASLSFIASLIHIAKERYESDQETKHFKGGIYPIIMDSPFGYLDPEYQRKVSQTMPEMSDQVVVLVTQSQWSEQVESEMEDKVGGEYHLDYQNPREDDAVEYEQTRIDTVSAQAARGD